MGLMGSLTGNMANSFFGVFLSNGTELACVAVNLLETKNNIRMLSIKMKSSAWGEYLTNKEGGDGI
jgi:hypothetical protein